LWALVSHPEEAISEAEQARAPISVGSANNAYYTSAAEFMMQRAIKTEA
jgi:hypothetical protein